MSLYTVVTRVFGNGTSYQGRGNSEDVAELNAKLLDLSILYQQVTGKYKEEDKRARQDKRTEFEDKGLVRKSIADIIAKILSKEASIRVTTREGNVVKARISKDPDYEKEKTTRFAEVDGTKGCIKFTRYDPSIDSGVKKGYLKFKDILRIEIKDLYCVSDLSNLLTMAGQTITNAETMISLYKEQLEVRKAEEDIKRSSGEKVMNLQKKKETETLKGEVSDSLEAAIDDSKNIKDRFERESRYSDRIFDEFLKEVEKLPTLDVEQKRRKVGQVIFI